MLIKLNQFVGYFKGKEPIQPVWVNPAHITYINTMAREVFRYDIEPTMDQPHRQKETINITVISFAVGLHEESDSISVIETPDEIIKRSHD